MSKGTYEKATVTVGEAAEILGIGRNLAYEAVKSGKIPSIRLGRKYLVPRAALDQMLKCGTAIAQPGMAAGAE